MDSLTSPFRKSSYSAQGGQTCVEVGAAGAVLVQDTVQAGDPQRVTLSITPSAWKTFLSRI